VRSLEKLRECDVAKKCVFRLALFGKQARLSKHYIVRAVHGRRSIRWEEFVEKVGFGF